MSQTRTLRLPLLDEADDQAGLRSGAEPALQALQALALSDTRSGVVARTTRHMDPLRERQKSRKRNGQIIIAVLDIIVLEL